MFEQKHTVKSFTPKHGATWIVKWISSVLVVLGLALAQASLPFGTATAVSGACLLLGSLGWWWTAYAWNDRALQLTTAVTSFIVTMDLLQTWL